MCTCPYTPLRTIKCNSYATYHSLTDKETEAPIRSQVCVCACKSVL